VVSAKASHFQRIGDTTAGFIRKVLYVLIDVVMRHQSCFALFEQRFDFGF
jgi:hypothetical protein